MNTGLSPAKWRVTLIFKSFLEHLLTEKIRPRHLLGVYSDLCSSSSSSTYCDWHWSSSSESSISTIINFNMEAENGDAFISQEEF
jgi:hypothetical protein